MKLRILLRLILLMTTLVVSGATTKVARAVPPGECSAWDQACAEDCWYAYQQCILHPPKFGYPDCNSSHDGCMSYCCIEWY
jgi:hypothetical protein